MSFTLPLGSAAPDFHLIGVDNKTHSLADFAGARALVVAFTCNHCPFVIGSEDRMNALLADYAPKGLAMIAINSNETDNHPTDSFPHMVERARARGFRFPYVRDDTQSVAKAYGALRTPHFFLFDSSLHLRYTGRLDNSPMDPLQATTHELRDALDAVLAGKTPAVPLTNPIGCNVKWKGQDAHWMPPDACDLVPPK
ncbi:MAG: thioredoxin family protein [Planctomycetota bacterium]|nr:thioredoxin family protein [Planctomycetota bacterium]